MILTLTPIVVVLAAIGFSHLLKTFYTPYVEDSADGADAKAKKSVKKSDETEDAAATEGLSSSTLDVSKSTRSHFLFSLTICLHGFHSPLQENLRRPFEGNWCTIPAQ